MNKFNVQVVVSIIKNDSKNQKIVSDSSGFQNLFFGSKNFEVEYKCLVEELINYCYEDEERHFDEFEDDEKPDDHIFLKIERLKKLNNLL